MADSIRTLPDLAVLFMVGCTIWVLGSVVVLGVLFLAGWLNLRDDEEEHEQLWPRERCRPPLRFHGERPFQ